MHPAVANMAEAAEGGARAGAEPPAGVDATKQPMSGRPQSGRPGSARGGPERQDAARVGVEQGRLAAGVRAAGDRDDGRGDERRPSRASGPRWVVSATRGPAARLPKTS